MPLAPGATATELDLNEGRRPVVPTRPDGVTGQGRGQPSVPPAPGAQDTRLPEDLVYAGPPRVPSEDASSTAEPQVASDGDRLLVTWNWGAAQSSDGGATFSYLDPWTAFPSAGDGFCCDQVAAYVPEFDLWVWVLQYLSPPGPSGSNLERVVVARGDDAFDRAEFSTYGFSPLDAGLDPGVWLDQPKIGWTDDALFLSANGFGPLDADGDATFVASVIWRLPFDGLVSGDLESSYITTQTYLDPWDRPLFGPYPVRDSGSTMYLAAHVDQATLAILGWPDDDPWVVSYHEVESRTPSGEPLVYPMISESYSCPTEGAADPVTSDWCAFGTDRILAGWRRGDVIGYAWNVPQGGGWDAAYPWVFAIEIDTTWVDRCLDGSCVVGYPSVWMPDRAAQYLAVAPNARGDLGGVVLAGGGPFRLTCYGLARAADAPPDVGWDIIFIAESDAESPEPRSGDYLGVTTYGAEGAAWLAGCMTLKGGPTGTTGQVHVASFGWRSDVEP
jgi:hypothetical protein